MIDQSCIKVAFYVLLNWPFNSHHQHLGLGTRLPHDSFHALRAQGRREGGAGGAADPGARY